MSGGGSSETAPSPRQAGRPHPSPPRSRPGARRAFPPASLFVVERARSLSRPGRTSSPAAGPGVRLAAAPTQPRPRLCRRHVPGRVRSPEWRLRLRSAQDPCVPAAPAPLRGERWCGTSARGRGAGRLADLHRAGHASRRLDGPQPTAVRLKQPGLRPFRCLGRV